MFSLFSGLWDYFFRQKEYNILILGVEKVRAPFRRREAAGGPPARPGTRTRTRGHAPDGAVPSRAWPSGDGRQAGKTTFLEQVKVLVARLTDASAPAVMPEKILPTVGLNSTCPPRRASPRRPGGAAPMRAASRPRADRRAG